MKRYMGHEFSPKKKLKGILKIRPLRKEDLYYPARDVKEKKKRKREKFLTLFFIILFVGLTIAEIKLTKVSSSLPFVNSIFFFGLLNINIMILGTLFWLIFRNIGKLFFEHRNRALGASLKTKLVLAFFSFSIIPTLLLFIISSSYINSSFDKWFSIKIQNTLEASLDITKNYYKNTEKNTLHFATHLADQLGSRTENTLFLVESGAFRTYPKWMATYLESQKNLLALDAVEFYMSPYDDRLIVDSKPRLEESLPAPPFQNTYYSYPRLSVDLLKRSFNGEKVTTLQHIGSGDLIRTLVPVNVSDYSTTPATQKTIGIVVVNSYIPISLVNKVSEISSVFADYKDTNPLKYPIKSIYFIILVMITLVIIFVAVWIGLYIARELTVPLEMLVRGADEVGSGNLEVEIEKSGQDEIAVVINAFNRMTHDLKENREKLTQLTSDLEKRKVQLETVLTNIGTGVIVVEKSKKIIAFNRAASELFQIQEKKALGKNYMKLLSNESAPLVEIIDRAFQKKEDTDTSLPEITQWNLRINDRQKSLAGIATNLKDETGIWGVVVVIDDMTHLVKAQREFAWREVARRVAHEIKNPLNPIKLSAQRLQRKLTNLTGKEREILKECTNTIVSSTDELKEMVNEFSDFARFPETTLEPYQLNLVLEDAIKLYTQAHPHIKFSLKCDPKLPVFEFDHDQIKRVFINLLDNAVAAFEADTEKSIKTPSVQIETHYNDILQLCLTTIKDNGPGINEDIKTRVFEPYFSTKKEGSGLGLAIAKRIINDHDGYIRVQSQMNKGTEFLIELPTSQRFQLDLPNDESSRGEKVAQILQMRRPDKNA